MSADLDAKGLEAASAAIGNLCTGSIINAPDYESLAEDCIRAYLSALALPDIPGGWRDIAETYRLAMLEAEAMLSAIPIKATDKPAILVDPVAVAVSQAGDVLRKARHDMIHKYGPSGPESP